MTLASNYSLMFIKCVAVVVLIAFTSCKKDDSEIIQPASSITGQWTGVLTKSGSTIGNLNIVILQNGTLEAQDTAGIKTADGTWQLGGSLGKTFTCSYTTNSATPLKYNFIGTLDTPTKMTGAFGTGSSHTNGGFWNMSKQ